MPANPLTVTIQNNGSRAALPVSNATLVQGTAMSGTDTAIVSIGSTAALLSTFTAGPLVQLAAQYLAASGEPIYCQRINDSVVAAMSAVTPTRIGASTGTIVNNASAPNDAYDVIIEILSTGTVAATSFTWRYTLDGGDNWSGTLQGAATASLGSSGIALTFADTAPGPIYFEDGDLHSFTTTAPGYIATDLTACMTALQNSAGVRVRRIHPATTSVTSSGLYSAIRTALNTLETAYKYCYVILESDDLSAGPEAVTAWQTGVLGDFTTEDDRVAVIAGWHEVQMVLPIGNDTLQLRRPHAWVVGPRLASIDVSQDAGAVLDGSLDNAVLDTVSVTYPTGLKQDGALYTAFEGRGITTCQTYLKAGKSGIYCGGGFMRVQPNNDYYRIAHRQVMDVACETLMPILVDWVNTNVGTNANGTILESEAQAKEAIMNAAIETNLVKTNPPRVSADPNEIYVVIDRTNVISTTHVLIVTVGLWKRPFIDSVSLYIGYRLSLPIAA